MTPPARERPEPVADLLRDDPILHTVARAVFALVMLFALHLLWRGHLAPGGGFIAGLTTSAALILYRIAFGVPATLRDLRALLPWGLGLAVLTGLVPFVLGQPFLKSAHGYVTTPLTGEFAWATAFLFDVGVYVVVVGVTMTIIRALVELASPTAPNQPGPSRAGPETARREDG